jgi:endonuclease/exonuclease/phosphatase family metal-dependent hydrolase
MFYNDKRVKMLEQQPIALDDPAGDEAGATATPSFQCSVYIELTRRSCSDYSADLLDRSRRGSVALLTKFQRCDDASEVFVVATTHLFWDPTQEDVKLLQSRRLLHHLDAFASVHQPLHTILAGDFNSLPDSEVYRFIREHGRFGSAYEYYPRTTASDSVLAEPSYTNVNGADAGTDGKQVARFVGTLDYIFYRSERCVPSLAWRSSRMIDANRANSRSATCIQQCTASGRAARDPLVRRSHQGSVAAQHVLALGPPAAPQRLRRAPARTLTRRAAGHVPPSAALSDESCPAQ